MFRAFFFVSVGALTDMSLLLIFIIITASILSGVSVESWIRKLDREIETINKNVIFYLLFNIMSNKNIYEYKN